MSDHTRNLAPMTRRVHGSDGQVPRPTPLSGTQSSLPAHDARGRVSLAAPAPFVDSA